MTGLEPIKAAGAWAWKRRTERFENPFIDFLKRRCDDAKSDSEKVQYIQARWNEFAGGKVIAIVSMERKLLLNLAAALSLLSLIACIPQQNPTPTKMPTRQVQLADTQSPPTLTPTSVLTLEPTSTLRESIPEALFPTSEIEDEGIVRLEEGNPYAILSKYEFNELVEMADEELLSLAPAIQIENYGFMSSENVSSLNPSYVVRIGESLTPFVVYTSQNGDVKLWWNIENGSIEFVERSDYSAKSGLQVTSYLVTGNNFREQLGKRVKLDEKNPGDLSMAWAEYALPINSYYTNHIEDFEKWVGTSGPGADRVYNNFIWKHTNESIQKFVEQARAVFKQDLSNLPTDGSGKLNIDMGRHQFVEVGNQEVVLIHRVNYSTSWDYSREYGGFSQSTFWRVSPKGGDTIIVDYSIDQRFLDWPVVGSPLLLAVRQATVGESLSIADAESGYNASGQPSLTGQLVFDLGGEGEVLNYLNLLGDDYVKNRVVPLLDWVTNVRLKILAYLTYVK